MASEQPKKDHWNADGYVHHASFVPKLGSIILGQLSAQPHEHILDFGCGDGALTRELATRCKSVVGIDASEDMIRLANETSSDIDYYAVDGHHLQAWFDETQSNKRFDAVFSNATLHWLKEPVKAIQSIHHVLKPGGRLAAEFGGFMNCGEIHSALIAAMNRRGFDGKALSPWFFPSPEHYKSLLTANGFDVAHIEHVPRMTELDTDLTGWLKTFAFNFVKVLSTEEERKQVIDEVVEQLRPCYQREDGKWFVMYVRLRVVALKRS
ncbi:S-adenosyl-L-methionine-dependent methyltransferase [Syncephalastrum racemosum]|uniref:S-adenosyl-L-methionine-dependent methyltransferase n=1 Tax=Syncephalastrum racemosum TaxID=13706 RepID=A0A1X2HC67_SYNRA|nr:S-adenosyl-L-methionine-dependent methyltransferase [Syncephalastrum racemosum]